MARPKGSKNKTPQERELAAAIKAPSGKRGRPPRTTSFTKIEQHLSSPSIMSALSSSSSNSNIKTWLERQRQHQHQQPPPPPSSKSDVTFTDLPQASSPHPAVENKNKLPKVERQSKLSDSRFGLKYLTSSSSAGSQTTINPATSRITQVTQRPHTPTPHPVTGPGYLAPLSESTSSAGSPNSSSGSTKCEEAVATSPASPGFINEYHNVNISYNQGGDSPRPQEEQMDLENRENDDTVMEELGDHVAPGNIEEFSHIGSKEDLCLKDEYVAPGDNDDYEFPSNSHNDPMDIDEEETIEEVPGSGKTTTHDGTRDSVFSDRENDVAENRQHPSDPQQSIMTDALFADPEWDVLFQMVPLEDRPTLKQFLLHIVASLQGKFHGCSDTEHRINMDIHNSSAGNNHHPLAATYRSLPADLKRLGLAKDVFPDNEGKSRKNYAKADDLRRVFCGKVGPNDEIKNICLHIEQAKVDKRTKRSRSPVGSSTPSDSGEEIAGEDDPGRSYTIQWDKDSLLYKTYHAGVFGKHGICYCPSQLTSMTTTMPNHLKFKISFKDAEGKTRNQSHHLMDIPHGYFGYAKGWNSCWVLIVFPHLFIEPAAFNQITKEVWKNFFDNVWFPAVKKHATNQNIQHLPTSWDQAEQRAKAQAAEIGTDPDQIRASHFSLGPEVVGQVWDTAKQLIREAGGRLDMFEGMFLVVQAKGFKTDFQKDGESLADVLDRVEQNAEDTWVMEHINHDEFWVDIGHEICPAPRNEQYGREPEILLWKKCCLEKQTSVWREQFDHEKLGKVENYTAFNMGEAGAMTLEHSSRSRARKYGLIYSQLYNSGKEVLDAQKVQPWESNLVDELSFDKRVWKGAATKARRAHGRNRDDLKRNHRAIKRRILRAITEATANSYGIRVEHRITWQLFKKIRKLARQMEDVEETPSATEFEFPKQPPYCWSILTREWCDYLLGNYEKFVETLEMVAWTSPKTGISRARTKFMATLFLCLRTFSTGRMHMYPMLWLGEQTRTDITKRGLNWKTLMSKHGYTWFEYSLVDFERFIFEKDISDELWISEESVLTYHPGNLNLIEVNDTMDQCSNLLKRFRDKVPVQGEILLLMAHVCFYQFRRDVLDRLSDYGELDEDAEGDVLADRVKFCMEGFDGIVAEVSLSTGNRPLKDPRKMATWLLGPDNPTLADGFPELEPTKKRTHFKDFFFRGLLDKALEILTDFPHLRQEWPELLLDQFFSYHWLMPYPNDKGQMMGKGYTNSNEDRAGERKWFAITAPREGTRPSKVDKERLLPTGVPADYPETLGMSEDQLEDYFESLLVREE